MKQLANLKLFFCIKELDISYNKNIDDSTIENFYNTYSEFIQKQSQKNKVIN